jgi:hypothetical protein
MAEGSSPLPYWNTRPVVDWTTNLDLPVSDFCQWLRDYDWASTRLGPMREWPPLLRQLVCQITSHPDPKVILWGPDVRVLSQLPAILRHKNSPHSCYLSTMNRGFLLSLKKVAIRPVLVRSKTPLLPLSACIWKND